MAHPTGESELNTDFDRFCFVEARHQNGEIDLVDRAIFGLILTDTHDSGPGRRWRLAEIGSGACPQYAIV